jgi:hypothetical protein
LSRATATRREPGAAAAMLLAGPVPLGLVLLGLAGCGPPRPEPAMVITQPAAMVVAQPAALVVQVPPPPEQAERMPPRPAGASTAVWQPGRWLWTGAAPQPWQWQQGQYVQAPAGQSTWMPGRWTQAPGGGWTWIEGHWA